jgi:hypothetical protein
MSFLLFGGRCGYLLIGLARGEDVVIWDAFTASLGSSHVSISEKEDNIIGQKILLTYPSNDAFPPPDIQSKNQEAAF